MPENLRLLATELQLVKQLHQEDVPNIELYMDQLITILDTQLSAVKPDATLPFVTNTMVNNYAKAGLLPPIKRKRYTKAHTLAIAFIGQLKRVLSITQLGKLIKVSAPVENEFSTEIYEVFTKCQKKCFENTENELLEAYIICKNQGFEGDALLAAVSVHIATKAHYMSMLSDKVLAQIDDGARSCKKAVEKPKS